MNKTKCWKNLNSCVNILNGTHYERIKHSGTACIGEICHMKLTFKMKNSHNKMIKPTFKDDFQSVLHTLLKEFICGCCFISCTCKTNGKNQDICHYVHEVNSKFQALFFVLSHMTWRNNFNELLKKGLKKASNRSMWLLTNNFDSNSIGWGL